MPSQIPTEILNGVSTTFTEFSRWVPWKDRSALKDRWQYPVIDYAGVYLLAHFEDPPSDEAADFLHDGIVYVGKSSWMLRRLIQFERAAAGGYGHSGGTSYYRKYSGIQHNLFVSALPVWLGGVGTASEQPLTSFFTAWAESHVITRIAVHRRNGSVLPLLNKP